MSLLSFFRSRGIRAQAHSSKPGWIQVDCPFCLERGRQPDGRLLLGINTKDGFANCFHCGFRERNFYHYLSEKGVEVTIEHDNAFDDVEPEEKNDHKVKLPEGFTLVTKMDVIKTPKKYLRSRGVETWQMFRHRIGCCLSGKYANRVVFPVYERDLLLGFVARDWTGKAAKRYLNSEGRTALYNFNSLRRTRGIVVITEGVFKCLAVERYLEGDGASVASLGLNLNDFQREQLPKTRELVFFCDPGEAGVLGYLNLARSLSHRDQKISFVYPLPKKQADELPKRDVIKLIGGRRQFSTKLDLQIMAEVDLG